MRVSVVGEKDKSTQGGVPLSDRAKKRGARCVKAAPRGRISCCVPATVSSSRAEVAVFLQRVFVRNLRFFSWGSGVSLVGGGLARLSGEGYLMRRNAMQSNFSNHQELATETCKVVVVRQT